MARLALRPAATLPARDGGLNGGNHPFAHEVFIKQRQRALLPGLASEIETPAAPTTSGVTCLNRRAQVGL
jgi:hypothetical protein